MPENNERMARRRLNVLNATNHHDETKHTNGNGHGNGCCNGDGTPLELVPLSNGETFQG